MEQIETAASAVGGTIRASGRPDSEQQPKNNDVERELLERLGLAFRNAAQNAE